MPWSLFFLGVHLCISVSFILSSVFFFLSLSLSIPLCSLPVSISYLFFTSSCFLSSPSSLPLSMSFCLYKSRSFHVSVSLYLHVSMPLGSWLSSLVFLYLAFHGSVCSFLFISFFFLHVSPLIFHPPSPLCHYGSEGPSSVDMLFCSQRFYSFLVNPRGHWDRKSRLFSPVYRFGS